MDSILKNFKNPWEDDNWVLQTDVLDTSVLDTNVLENNVLTNLDDIIEELGSELNPYRGYCFDEKGILIARFKYVKPSGGVYIVLRSVKDVFPNKKNESKKDRHKRYFEYLRKHRVKMSDFYHKYQFDKKLFPASSISKIYTELLKDFDYDLVKLQNGKLSVYGSSDYQYNDANPSKGELGTTYKGLNPPAKFRITIGTSRLNLLNYVGDTINALGAHEYEGHGIKSWNDDNDKHHEVYEWQFAHSSWSKTTNYFKAYMVDNYLNTYILREARDEYWAKHEELKKKYGHLKEFNDVWRD